MTLYHAVKFHLGCVTAQIYLLSKYDLSHYYDKSGGLNGNKKIIAEEIFLRRPPYIGCAYVELNF